MKNKKRIYRTITLEAPIGNPVVSLYPGKAGAREFNAGYKKEGWEGSRIYRNQLYFGYWVKKGKNYKKAEAGTKGAKLYTAVLW